MNIRGLLVVPTLITASALALSGCSGTLTKETGKLDVLASFYPLQFAAQRIGGDLVNVTSLTPPGAEPHDLELSPAEAAKISKAGAVIYIKGFQPSVDKAIAETKPKNALDVSPNVKLVDAQKHASEENEASQTKTAPADHDHDHKHEDGHKHEDTADHKNTDKNPKENADHNAHEHKHTMSTDPHFWLDPNRMALASQAIVQTLKKADPKNSATYDANAKKLETELNALGKELVDSTKTCKHRTFVTAHAAFGYLSDITGLKQVGISGLDPEQTPAPARLKEISEIVKKHGLNTIFTETKLGEKTSQTLVKELGVNTKVLDPVEIQADKNKDYIAVMKENIKNLQDALVCKG